ncbi:BA75_04362T0 [Komagataella pastoris]|uniref:BA75_04362T0 n=1 Tax=Komagataella pastoris TaxID=4922 RepID=A0A1B2JH25_PICPA|nr:BA75_04362T0 [Komagataella pastoris]
MNLISEVIERDLNFQSTTQETSSAENVTVVSLDGFPVATKKRPSKWSKRLRSKKPQTFPTEELKSLYERTDPVLESNRKLKLGNDTVELQNLSQKTAEQSKDLSEYISQESLPFAQCISSENEKTNNYINAQAELPQCVEEPCCNKIIEGYGAWIGGRVIEPPSISCTETEGIKLADNTGAYSSGENELTRKCKLGLESEFQQPLQWDDVEYSNELHPNYSDSFIETGMPNSTLHTPRPAIVAKENNYAELDLNDPKFNEKLHQKYFPDLPAHPEQLAWMSPVTDETGEGDDVIYDDVKDIRFDFRGEMIPTSKVLSIPTAKGLHHHSRNPGMAGYTLHELASYACSTFPSQKCIAIRTLGRILYKLGKHSYPLSVDGIEDYYGDRILLDSFEATIWKLIEEFHIIEILIKSSDERETSNLSIRSYAVEALWLWRAGRGDKNSLAS